MQIVKSIQAGDAKVFAASIVSPIHSVERVNSIVEDIVAAAQAGSSAAFAELHSIYSQRLYRIILSITRDARDAEEALQDTFLRAYLAIKTFEGKSKVNTWLTRIAVNSALMILRKRRVRSEVLLDPIWMIEPKRSPSRSRTPPRIRRSFAFCINFNTELCARSVA